MADNKFFNRLVVIISALRETTITTDRLDWFSNLFLEFKAIEQTLKHEDLQEWQKNVLNNAREDFDEGSSFFNGKTITNPSLHYNN